MSEYLRIEHFGPIEYVEFEDIRPFTVLIGMSGSGKSTIMKVLSLFRWMYKRVNLRSFIKHSGINKTKIGFRTESLLRKSGLLEYLTSDSKIVYRNGRYEIAMQKRSTTAGFIVAPEDLSLEKISFISDKRAILPDLLGSTVDRHKDNYYLQETLENFRMAIKQMSALKMDYLGVEFSSRKLKNGQTEFKISGNGANGDYNINLTNASSGIQTSTPAAIIVEYFASCYNIEDSLNHSLLSYFVDSDNLASFKANKNVGDFKNKRVHLFIEEPELSLYPDNQIEFIDFLADRCFLRKRDYEMTLMMATHSPYIANYLNLIMARYGSHGKGIALSPDDIGVYLIEDGCLTDLKIENSEGKPFIDTTRLSDPISEIYSRYNELSDV